MTGPAPAAITQAALPHAPWTDPALARMPGMRPVAGPWIMVDDAFAAQMAERERLIRDRPGDVIAALPDSGDAVDDLFATVLRDLPDGYRRDGEAATRPDGVAVPLDDPSLATLGRLVQCDLLLLEKRRDEHVLVAGVLCFPANWSLAQKIGRPLRRIHAPVDRYDDALARRVQRLFDRARAGVPMWRANVLPHDDAVLFHPRPEWSPQRAADRPPPFLRSERQTVLRLPRTGAILFAVHTTVVAWSALTPQQRATCPLG